MRINLNSVIGRVMYNVSSCLFFAEADKGLWAANIMKKLMMHILRAFVLFNSKLLFLDFALYYAVCLWNVITLFWKIHLKGKLVEGTSHYHTSSLSILLSKPLLYPFTILCVSSQSLPPACRWAYNSVKDKKLFM